MEHETTSKPCTCAQVYERLRDQIAARRSSKFDVAHTIHCEAHPPGSPEWEQLVSALQEPGMKVVSIAPGFVVHWLAEDVGVAIERSRFPLEDLLSTLTVTGPGGELVEELLRSAIAFRDAARRMREHARTHQRPRRKK